MLTPWVGPMPVHEFLDTFMPVPERIIKKCPEVEKDFFKQVSLHDQSTQKEMLLKVMCNAPFLSGYKLVSASNNDKTHCQWSILTCFSDKVDLGQHDNDLDKAEWRIIFEPKAANGPDVDCINENQSSPRTQLALCAAEWLNHQHRTHIFMIFISQSTARFLYFDRSGAVVTQGINYAEDSTPIVQFMWYFSHLTPEQKGVDTTVTLAHDVQAKKFREKLANFHIRVATLEVKPSVIEILKAKKRERSGKMDSGDDLMDGDWDAVWDIAEASVSSALSEGGKADVSRLVSERMPCKSQPVICIQVPDGDGHRVVIGQGLSLNTECVVGRSTRTCPVWDPKDDKLFYLKDTWRSFSRALETDFLKELNEKGINRVPRLVCGGDIADHKTRTAELAGAPNEGGNRKPWVYGKVVITPRRHHRFIVDFIGRSIEHFSHSKQMLQAVYDAFNAHKEAWERCGILHRDISVNNVMLDRWGRGVLNDWDLAKKENELSTGTRTGTWYFMSTLMVQIDGKQHTVQDDIESFVLLVLYLGLSYLQHNYNDGLGHFMYRLFEEAIRVNGSVVGSVVKLTTFTNSFSFIDRFEFKGNSSLTGWLKEAFEAVSEWILAYIDNNNNLRRRGSRKRQPEDMTALDLHNHDFLSSIFEQALASPDWPDGPDKFVNDFEMVDESLYLYSAASVVTSKRGYDDLFDFDEAPRKKPKRTASSGIDGMQVEEEKPM